MSTINVDIVAPFSGDFVTVNGLKVKATSTSVQLNNASSLIPSNDSVVLGMFAGTNLLSSGSENTLIGRGAGSAMTTGAANTFIGRGAGSQVTTGTANVYIGKAAGSNVNPIGNNVYIGNSSGIGVAGANNTLIGSFTGTGGSTNENITCLGNGAVPSSSSVFNQITLGNSSITTLRCAVTSITSLSDARDKKEVAPIELGLEFVKELNPVKFVWDDRNEEGKHDVVDSGFIAQDLKALEDKYEAADVLKLVYDENPEKLEASYGRLIPVLVQAIKDLAAEVEALKTK
jgi:hypothetical protein